MARQARVVVAGSSGNVGSAAVRKLSQIQASRRNTGSPRNVIRKPLNNTKTAPMNFLIYTRIFRQEELRIFRFSGFESPSVLFSLPHAHLRCTPNRDVRADSLHRELRLRPRYDCLVAPCVSTRTPKSPSAYILASGKDAVRPHWAKTDAKPTAARTPPR